MKFFTLHITKTQWHNNGQQQVTVGVFYNKAIFSSKFFFLQKKIMFERDFYTIAKKSANIILLPFTLGFQTPLYKHSGLKTKKMQCSGQRLPQRLKLTFFEKFSSLHRPLCFRATPFEKIQKRLIFVFEANSAAFLNCNFFLDYLPAMTKVWPTQQIQILMQSSRLYS